MKDAADGPTRGDCTAAGRHVVRWERFLPRRSLKVLLVEHDDSTRHLVTALLRKCAYHVVAVADGLKAWEVLNERRCGFDIVLTEVAIPSLSGIGLLVKIMASEDCKNIPVIMMSSHDSIGVVYNCMLKGAVDFLVKPVRKNELQNLWQHVWRKHCSSSFANVSDNNAASNHISANAGDRSRMGKNSDEESDAQSSGNKPDAEIESVWKIMEHNQAEHRRLCREMEAKPEQPVNGVTISADVLKNDDFWGRSVKSVESRVEVILPIQETCRAQEGQKPNHSYKISPCRNGEEDPFPLRSKDGSHLNDNASNESLQSMVCLVKPTANTQCSYAFSKDNVLSDEVLHADAQVSHAKNASDRRSLPLLELSLRRPQPNGCLSQEFKDRHTLIHSNASAFSRYGEKRIHPSSEKPVSSGLCSRTRENDDKYHSSVHIHGINDEKNTCFLSREIPLSSKGNEGEAMLYLQVSSGGNKEEAGILPLGPLQEDASSKHSSIGKVMFSNQPQHGFISLPVPVKAMPYQSFCAGYGAIMHPMLHPETSLMQHHSDVAGTLESQIHCDQSGQQDKHHFSNANPFKSHSKDDHLSYHMRQPNSIEASGPNAFSCSPAEPVNQSKSCSPDVLNGVGSSSSGDATDAAGNTGIALESGNESVQNCNRKAMDSDRAHREAALIKFRLKRKDRCFEKKVRYHSRKKLAEQRPRVKGQFVRQKVLTDDQL